MPPADVPDPRDHPYDPDGRQIIDDKARALIEFLTGTFEHRQEKRVFKREHADIIPWWRRDTLDSLWKVNRSLMSDQISKIKSATSEDKKDAARRKFREHEQIAIRIVELRGQKEEDKTQVETLSREFKAAIDQRIQKLKIEASRRKREHKRDFKATKRALLSKARRLKSLNSENLKSCYPLRHEPEEDDPAHKALADAKAAYEELLGVELGVEGDDLEAAEGDPADAKLLDVQRSFRLYQDHLQVCPDEIDALGQLKRMPSILNRLWKFADKIDKWYDTLYSTALDTRTYTTGVKLKERKRKRLQGEMGSKELAIEFGAALEALFELGLSVVLTGSLQHDDDRSLVAHISLQLVVSAELKVGGTSATFGPETKEIIKFGAKAGFTIADQSYIFLDERHFAYYMAFRIANLLILGEHFGKYKDKAYNQYVQLYDERLKDTLSRILANNKSAATMEELEFYLSNNSVVHSSMAFEDRWKPEMEGEAKEGVLGSSLNLKGAPMRSFIHLRERLEMHENGGTHYSLVKERKRGYEREMSIKVALPLWLATKVDLIHTRGESRDHPNLRLAGRFKRYRLGGGLLSHGLKFSEKDPGELPENAQEVAEGWKKYVPRAPDDVKWGWESELELDMNLLSFFVEWYYGETVSHDRKHHYVLFSRRRIRSGNLQASLKIPVSETGRLKIGFARAAEVVTRERLGTGTLSYLRRIHDGLKARSDGDEAWTEFVGRHRSELWKLFHRAAGNESYKGKDNALLLDDMKGLEERYSEFKHLLENGDRLQDIPLRQECKDAAWKQQKAKKAFKKKSTDFAEPDDKQTFDGLLDSLSRLFVAVGQIDELQDGSWRRERHYLLPQSGTLTVHLHWDGQRYIVGEAPILKDRSLLELWTQPQLRQAKSLLPFYRSNMQLVLRLHGDNGSIRIVSRHPDGDNNLQHLLEKLCAAVVGDMEATSSRYARTAKGKPKQKMEQLEALLRIDPELWQTFEDWLKKVKTPEARDTAEERRQLIAESADLLDDWAGHDGNSRFEAILDRLTGPYLAFASSRDVKSHGFELVLGLKDGAEVYTPKGRPRLVNSQARKFARREEFAGATSAHPFATTPLPFALKLPTARGMVTVEARLANGTRELKRMLDKLCAQLIADYDATSSIKAQKWSKKPPLKREQLRALVRLHEHSRSSYEQFLDDLDTYQEARRDEKGKIRKKTRVEATETQLETKARASWDAFVAAIVADADAGRSRSKDPYEAILYSLQLG